MGVLKTLFFSDYDLGKHFFGHSSRIDDVPIKLTQFCYITSFIYGVLEIWHHSIIKVISIKRFALVGWKSDSYYRKSK